MLFSAGASGSILIVKPGPPTRPEARPGPRGLAVVVAAVVAASVVVASSVVGS